jgi:hypothetical protein
LSSRQKCVIKALVVGFAGCLRDTGFNVLTNIKYYIIIKQPSGTSKNTEIQLYKLIFTMFLSSTTDFLFRLWM